MSHKANSEFSASDRKIRFACQHESSQGFKLSLELSYSPSQFCVGLRQLRNFGTRDSSGTHMPMVLVGADTDRVNQVNDQQHPNISVLRAVAVRFTSGEHPEHVGCRI